MNKKPTAEEQIKEEFSDTDISLLGEVNTRDLIERLSSVAEAHANNAVEEIRKKIISWPTSTIPTNTVLSMISDLTNKD